MWNFQDTFETRKQLFISAFSVCMTVPLWHLDQSNPQTFPIGQLEKEKKIKDGLEIVCTDDVLPFSVVCTM